MASPDYANTIYTAEEAINALFILISSGLIILMQAGFALLENGTVRSKNSQNILIKNIFDGCASGLAFWLLGYGFAFGQTGEKGGFIGYDKNFFAGSGFENLEEDHYLSWIFQYSFAATAATIVSGSIAERTQLPAYFGYSIFMTAFIYPVVVSWTWGEGWLYDRGFTDFAGTGIVHMLGGVSGMIASIILGPRFGKGRNDLVKSVFECPKYKTFEARSSSKEEFRNYVILNAEDQDFEEHSVPFVVIGTIMLWVSWLFFNGGSTTTMFEVRTNGSPKIMMNTIIAGTTSGLTAALFKPLFLKHKHKYDVQSLCNGLLGGLVSITGVCNDCDPWAAFVIGLIGGLVYSGSCKLFKKLYVDDPIDASSVHGFCGIWGVLAVGIFSKKNGLFSGEANDRWGFFGWQVLGMLAICLWGIVMSGLYFLLMKYLGLYRVPLIEEVLGLDIAEMGVLGKISRKTIVFNHINKDLNNNSREDGNKKFVKKSNSNDNFFKDDMNPAKDHFETNPNEINKKDSLNN